MDPFLPEPQDYDFDIRDEHDQHAHNVRVYAQYELELEFLMLRSVIELLVRRREASDSLKTATRYLVHVATEMESRRMEYVPF